MCCNNVVIYPTDTSVLAFTAGTHCQGTEPGIDARETGLRDGSFAIPASRLMIPRQTHSTHVQWVEHSGEVPDTDAVITSRVGLCVAVKTADCIPILLHDRRQRLVAAVHAGWRGTVGRILELTIQTMRSHGSDLQAIIGPGISLEAFEVGDEVYDAFRTAGFPMERIARAYPSATADTERWHIDLWDANRWLLEEHGVTDIHLAGICTYTSARHYSARRDTINTGRNINGIMLLK